MPRWRRAEITRIALPADQLESKIMGMLRGPRSCAKLKGVAFVFVGSFGQEPNCFVRPRPSRVSDACMREFRDGSGAREKGVRLGVGAELARVTVARGVLNQKLERLLRRENPGFFFG